jgi:hypothetical protein
MDKKINAIRKRYLNREFAFFNVVAVNTFPSKYKFEVVEVVYQMKTEETVGMATETIREFDKLRTELKTYFDVTPCYRFESESLENALQQFE